MGDSFGETWESDLASDCLTLDFLVELELLLDETEAPKLAYKLLRLAISITG